MRTIIICLTIHQPTHPLFARDFLHVTQRSNGRPAGLSLPGLCRLGPNRRGTRHTRPQSESLPEVVVQAPKREATPDSKQNYQALTTTAGKGKQALKDIPQSVTVVTEKLMDDKNADTLKAAMHTVSGIAFEAGEGGAIGDLIRLRGFTTRGDIFQDGMRDIAQYNRDTFNQDRIEVLRGSASMLYGRGSTGSVINQASKQPFLATQHEVEATVGTDNYVRLTGDFNIKTADDAALRINVMKTDADSFRNGPETHRLGVAPHSVGALAPPMNSALAPTTWTTTTCLTMASLAQRPPRGQNRGPLVRRAV